MNSPTSKLSQALPCYSNLRFRQLAGHRSESGSRLTCNPSYLELASDASCKLEMGNGLGTIAILEIDSKVEASLQHRDSLEWY